MRINYFREYVDFERIRLPIHTDQAFQLLLPKTLITLSSFMAAFDIFVSINIVNYVLMDVFNSEVCWRIHIRATLIWTILEFLGLYPKRRRGCINNCLVH